MIFSKGKISEDSKKSSVHRKGASVNSPYHPIEPTKKAGINEQIFASEISPKHKSFSL